jgi:hypothetical protein
MTAIDTNPETANLERLVEKCEIAVALATKYKAQRDDLLAALKALTIAADDVNDSEAYSVMAAEINAAKTVIEDVEGHGPASLVGPGRSFANTLTVLPPPEEVACGR